MPVPTAVHRPPVELSALACTYMVDGIRTHVAGQPSRNVYQLLDLLLPGVLTSKRPPRPHSATP
jgi:hypothetical protein